MMAGKLGLGCHRNKQKKSVRTETNRSKICFGSFRFVSVFRIYIEISKETEVFRNKNETNRNNPKFSLKCQNMLSIKLFWLVFCLFRFNRNIETLCFGIEAKQPKLFQNKPKQTGNTLHFLKKYAPYQSVLVGLLFRYRGETTETNVLFRIVPKLVSVPVSVVSNQN